MKAPTCSSLRAPHTPEATARALEGLWFRVQSQATFKHLKQFVLYLEIHSDSVDSIWGWLLLGTAAISQSAEQVQRAAFGLAYGRGLFLLK